MHEVKKTKNRRELLELTAVKSYQKPLQYDQDKFMARRQVG